MDGACEHWNSRKVSTRALATNAFWSLLSHVFSRGSLILASIFLARSLATPIFAAYSYFQLTVSMLAAYASMGLGITASRYFAEVGHDRPGDQPPPLGMLCLLSLTISAAAFALVIALPAPWINAGLEVPQWLLAAGVACTALGVIPGGAILGLERYREATIISAVSGALMLLAAWWAAQHQASLIAMLAVTIAALLQAVGQFAIVVRVVGWGRLRIAAGMHRCDLHRVFRFAGPMLLVSLMAASGSWLVGRIILHMSGGQYAFSLYSIGLQWFGLALVIPGMISRVVLPRLVRTSEEIAGSNSKRLVHHGAMLATIAAAGMTLVGALFGPWLMMLYGSHYDPGRWFVAAFMGAAILSAPANTLGNAIVARDGQKSWLVVTCASFLTLVMAALIATRLGAWSGALAQAVGAMTLVALGLLVAKRKGLV